MINNYTNILQFGHKLIQWEPDDIVYVQEKVDGSAIYLGKLDGKVYVRSKNKMIDLENPEKMFNKAVQVALSLDLREGVIYRCEYLATPKHNTLQYERTPNNYIIIYDMDWGNQDYLLLGEEANRIGLEYIPYWWTGRYEDLTKSMLDEFLQRKSILGGMVEGVVIKNYERFDPANKVSMAKYVSDKFKETHQTDWKQRNPNRADFMEGLAERYRTEARWNKAVQHLNEEDELTNSMQDISRLLAEVSRDVKKECEDEIKEELFKYFWKRYSKVLTKGLPDWYKENLKNS